MSKLEKMHFNIEDPGPDRGMCVGEFTVNVGSALCHVISFEQEERTKTRPDMSINLHWETRC